MQSNNSYMTYKSADGETAQFNFILKKEGVDYAVYQQDGERKELPWNKFIKKFNSIPERT